MANDPNEIVIAKGGKISSALLGATLPGRTDPRAALSGFHDVGYVTEDGAAVSGAPDILGVPAWQSSRDVRREVQRRDFTVTFGLLQWNSGNITLAFGGGRVREMAAGVATYDFPSDDEPLDEISLVIDWEDRYLHRIVFERGNVTEATETSLQRTSPAILPVTYSVLDGVTLANQDGDIVPGFYVTDDPAFTPVS